MACRKSLKDIIDDAPVLAALRNEFRLITAGGEK